MRQAEHGRRDLGGCSIADGAVVWLIVLFRPG